MKFCNVPLYFLKWIGFYNEIQIGRRINSDDFHPYYIIRRAFRWGGVGFFSNYFFALSHFAHALGNGYRPVIDMHHYNTLYSEREPVKGERNAWNYFFQQPYSIKDAYKHFPLVLGNAFKKFPPSPFVETNELCDLNPTVAPMLQTMAKRFLPIRDDLVQAFTKEFSERFQGKRILGVHFRGGDKRIPPPGHRMTIARESLLAAVLKLAEEHNPDAIFLASDEDGIAEWLESETQLPVIQLKAMRLPKGSCEGLHTRKSRSCRPQHRYLLGLEVLRDAWFLSKCNYLVYGHSNVTNAALFFRERPYDAKILVNSGSPAT